MEKNKIGFKKILTIFSLCLISIFAFLPILKNLNISYVSADSVDQSYSFNGSNLYYFDTFRFSYVWDKPYPVLYSVSFDNVNSVDSVRVYPKFLLASTSGSSMSYLEHSLFIDYYNTSTYVDLPLNSGKTLWFSTTVNDMTSGTYFPVDCFVSPGFNCNVYKISISLDDFLYFDTLPSNMKAVNLCYYDVNGNFISFGFYVPLNYQFDNRTYYLNNPDSFTGDESYNSGYSNGYDEGLGAGKEIGYINGYDVGLIEGFNNGYNDGVNDSNQYSFYNLFGAVVDAPVKVFSGLFNFELLGVNLLGLITGLFTLAMVILIVKLILGGK